MTFRPISCEPKPIASLNFENPFIQILQDPNLSLIDKLKKIGLIDDNYNLLFIPSEIPPISHKGQARFNQLMEKEVLGCDANGEIVFRMKESEYIKGFNEFLALRGIKLKTYLRGGYAAYVADLDEYLKYLIQEFCGANIGIESIEDVPTDVDLFDYVINEGIPPTALRAYFTEFLNQKDIKFLQLLIPKVSPLFPHRENYVLFTLGDESFQTDRIIGRLNHEYLYTRDDIRIEITANQLRVPESASNFWQMVIDRKLKIVRTEGWHEKDFRSGLAALQLTLDGHILIEDKCSLMSIFCYALSTGSDKIFQAAIDRARLHCKNKSEFLTSVLEAYLNAAKKMGLTIPAEHLQILTNEIGVKQVAFELTPYERVQMELALQKPLTPLTESMKDAIVEYLLLEDDIKPLAELLAPWIPAKATKMGWIKALFGYSFKHGRKLWDGSKDLMDQETRWMALEELFSCIGQNHPNSCYVLLEEESIPTNLRIKLLKTLIKSPYFSLQTSVKTIKEFLQENTLSDIRPFIIQTLERLPSKEAYRLWKKVQPFIPLMPIADRLITQNGTISEEDEAWFFNSNPSRERIEALYLSLNKDVDILFKWINLNNEISTFETHKEALQTKPALYIAFIKQHRLDHLITKWMADIPLSEKLKAALLFSPCDGSLVKFIAALPGIREKELIEALYSKGASLFTDRSTSDLLALMEINFSAEITNEILKALENKSFNIKELKRLQCILKANTPLSLDVIAHILDARNTQLLPVAVNQLILLKSSKLFSDQLWLKALNQPINPIELLPFYKNRSWVRSVYGPLAEAQAEKWAQGLLTEGKLNQTDKIEIQNILSRTKRLHTPLTILKHYMEFSYNEKIERNTIKTEFYNTVSELRNFVQLDSEARRHFFEMLIKFIKLGMAAKLYSLDGFAIIEEMLPFVPLTINEEIKFDPLFHLLQTLPFVDDGTEEHYLTWNNKKLALLEKWKEATISEELEVKDLHRNLELKILPYAVMQETLKYTRLFILITEQYIESKVSKEEFQLEVQDLSKCISNENPSLNCIQDLLHLVRIPTKRKRAYEAFYYLLGQKKNVEQKHYLEIRQSVENFIISESDATVKNKKLYSHFVNSIHQFIKKIPLKKENLPIQDPILDAFGMECLSPLEKIDLYLTWVTELERVACPNSLHQAMKIRSQVACEQKILKEEETFSHFKKKVDLLKHAKDLSAMEEVNEAVWLLNLAVSCHLPSDEYIKIHKLVENALGRTFPQKTQSDVNHSVALSYAEAVTQEDTPQYTAFYTVLSLLKQRIESGALQSNYFTLLSLMQPKAPLYLLEIENKVVHDPYAYFMQFIALIDTPSRDQYNQMNREKEEFFQLWLERLASSEKSHVAQYAKERPPLEFLPYDTCREALKYTKEFKYNIQQKADQKLSEEAFQNKIKQMCASAAKKIPLKTLTRHTDPCFKAISELCILLKNKEKRMPLYTAMFHIFDQWKKSFPVKIPHIDHYIKYLEARKSTEDLILNQYELVTKNKILYVTFFKTIIAHFKTVLESGIYHPVPIIDPVADAFALEELPTCEKSKLLHYWINSLDQSNAPMATCQVDLLKSTLNIECNKLTEHDVEQFLYKRIEMLKRLKPSLDSTTINDEIEAITHGSLALSNEKATAIQMKLP